MAGVFTPVPARPPRARAAWTAAGAGFKAIVREQNDGALDRRGGVLGRAATCSAAWSICSCPGGRLVFYGATSGYTLAFLGKPGPRPAREMLRRADLRPNEGVLVYYGARRRARRRGGRRGDRGGAAGGRARRGGRAAGRPGGARAGRAPRARRGEPGDARPGRRLSLARGDARLRHRSRRLPRVPGPHAQAVRPGGGPAPRHARQSARQPRRGRRAGRPGHARRQHVPGAAVHRPRRLRGGRRATGASRSTRPTCGCTRSASCSRRSRSSAPTCPTPIRPRRSCG